MNQLATKKVAIKVNLTALQDILHTAALTIDEAIERLNDESVDAAIGAILSNAGIAVRRKIAASPDFR